MDSKADEYREKAEEAETRSEKTNDCEAKITWREVAEHWRYMAAQAERNGW